MNPVSGELIKRNFPNDLKMNDVEAAAHLSKANEFLLVYSNDPCAQNPERRLILEWIQKRMKMIVASAVPGRLSLVESCSPGLPNAAARWGDVFRHNH